MSRFVDVILPLPISDTFTYSVPAELEDAVLHGCRVLVQFGRKKVYTGIVAALHDNEPEGYEVKEILQVLDEEAIVVYPQLKLWHWISDYYLCTLGEVYKAAVPAGLKIESETFIGLNRDYEPDGDVKLTERQSYVVAALQSEERISIKQLADRVGDNRVSAVVSKLLALGIVEVDERAVEHYRPEKKVLVRLTLERGDEDGLHEIFGRLTRSRAQERALIGYLDKSGWLQSRNELREVTRKELLEATGVSPGALKMLVDKGIFEVYKKNVNRFNQTIDARELQPIPTLSSSQQQALKEITDGFREHNVMLLHGVTGSGKTEIYMHLINSVLEKGRQVLFLVPEISLTTQLTDRLRKVFGDKLLVYHSKFSDSERVDIWKKLLTNKDPLVVLGARSATFLPYHTLGLVIVDEEHESSYKQYDPAPRYNARDTATVLASLHGARTLFGSATPSIETYYKALEGKYGLVELNERYSGAVLPDVEIVDMKRQRKQKENRGSLSRPLIDSINRSIGSQRQAIIFQNRRGFAPIVVCRECGWTPKCANCDVSMVYHKNINQLRCHYCGAYAPLPALCPACGLNGIETYGYGTERIAEEVHEQFPEARVARMDLDTTRNKHAYQEIIEEFARQDTNILVGTQMVTKGLDFERVDVVGVVNADTMLNFPDFRSDERAFNMLEQVAGRAGRRQDKGKVIIQTTNPANEILAQVAAHDFKNYYQQQIHDRQKFGYPPFTKVINIYLKHREQMVVDSLAVAYVMRLRSIFGPRVLGPEKPYIGRVANWYIQTVMLKVEATASMRKVKAILMQVYEEMVSDPRMKQARIYYDVDPM